MENRELVCQQLGVREEQEPGNYLGMPMKVGANKVSTFNFVQERVQQRLQGYGDKVLSKAGKMTVLKTAVQAIPNFWMSLFLIPMEICEGIERRMNAFWWCNKTTGRGIRWMSWDKLCVSKAGGGLGFKSLRSFNVSMLAKQGWRLINNANPLVTRIMRAKYFPNSDFLDASLGANPSYVWRSIMEAQENLKQGCRKRIGDGQSTRIWKVPWLPCLVDGCLQSPMPDDLAQALVQGLMTEEGRTWDEDILRDLCNERDMNLIKQVPIPIRGREDSWFWLMDEKGHFTVRSCYRRLQGETHCTEAMFWKKLWSLNLPGKVLNFLWRTCRDVLPVATALVTRRVSMSLMCPWCQSNEEDAGHMLFGCMFAKDVWRAAGLLEVISAEVGDNVFEVLRNLFMKCSREQCVLIGLLSWSLWNRRNKWVWDRVNMSVFGVRASAMNLLADWKKANERECNSRVQHELGARMWTKPPAEWVTINIDAACEFRRNKVGMGCVVRDNGGNFLRARSNVTQPCVQPRMAEAMSLRETLSWVKDWRRTKCIFESDSKLLVDALNGERSSSYFDTIVEDCVELLKHYDEVLVRFVYRSANNAAHLLARAAYSMSDHQEWLYTAPSIIDCTIAIEKF